MKSSRAPGQAPITLVSLLRRRKLTLEGWVTQNGIFTYELLKDRCSRIGVVPPSFDDFMSVLPKKEISSPTEGIVVLQPPVMISEVTGEPIEEIVDGLDPADDLPIGRESPIQEQDDTAGKKKRRR